MTDCVPGRASTHIHTLSLPLYLEIWPMASLNIDGARPPMTLPPLQSDPPIHPPRGCLPPIHLRPSMVGSVARTGRWRSANGDVLHGHPRGFASTVGGRNRRYYSRINVHLPGCINVVIPGRMTSSSSEAVSGPVEGGRWRRGALMASSWVPVGVVVCREVRCDAVLRTMDNGQRRGCVGELLNSGW